MHRSTVWVCLSNIKSILRVNGVYFSPFCCIDLYYQLVLCWSRTTGRGWANWNFTLDMHILTIHYIIPYLTYIVCACLPEYQYYITSWKWLCLDPAQEQRAMYCMVFLIKTTSHLESLVRMTTPRILLLNNHRPNQTLL